MLHSKILEWKNLRHYHLTMKGQVEVNIELIGIILALVLILAVGYGLARAGVSDTDIAGFESLAKDLNSLPSSQLLASKRNMPLDLSSNGIIVFFGSKQTTLTDLCGEETVKKPGVPECREACLCLYEDTASDDETFQKPPVRCSSLGKIDVIFIPTYYKGVIGSWEYGNTGEVYDNPKVPAEFRDLGTVLTNFMGGQQPLSSALKRLYPFDTSQAFLYGQCEDWVIDKDLARTNLYAEALRIPGEDSALFLTAENPWTDLHQAFVQGKLITVAQDNAQEAFQKQSWDEAVVGYRTLVNELGEKLGPEILAEARLKLSASLYRLEKKEDAKAQLQHIESKNGDLLAATALLRARISIAEKNDEKTSLSLQAVPETAAPELQQITASLKGDLLEKEGKWQEAKNLFGKTFAHVPESAFTSAVFTGKEKEELYSHAVERYNHIEADQLTPEHVEKVLVQKVEGATIHYQVIFDSSVFMLSQNVKNSLVTASKLREGAEIPYGKTLDELLTVRQVVTSATDWCKNCPEQKLVVNDKETIVRLPPLTPEQQATLDAALNSRQP